MILATDEITVSRASILTNAQIELIRSDPNVLRSLMGKQWNEAITGNTSWITINGNHKGTFIGAFMCDKIDIKTGAVCMHIMLREGYSRSFALQATKLAAFLCRIQGLIPYTTVSTDPKYDYMRKFLADCGFVHHMYKDDIEIITIPTHYVPTLPYVTLTP